MENKPKVLAAMAHPDDMEFLCAGTLRLLVERGWELHCVTLSGGDMGAPRGTRAEIRDMGAPRGTRAEIRDTRRREAEDAARLLGGSYVWAGLDDLSIYYCPEQLTKVTDVVRRFAPDMVITDSPACYMLDHEETAKLVQMACFAAGIPLFPGPTPATKSRVPVLYYADAVGGRTSLANRLWAISRSTSHPCSMSDSRPWPAMPARRNGSGPTMGPTLTSTSTQNLQVSRASDAVCRMRKAFGCTGHMDIRRTTCSPR